MSHPDEPLWQGPVNRAHPLNRGLTAWWLVSPAPGARGKTWRDLCQVSHASLSGDAAQRNALGRPGGWGCVELDGSGDYADTGASNLTRTNPYPISVSCWAMADTTNQGFLVAKEASAADTALWNLGVVGSVWAFGYGSTGGVVRASAGSMSTGVWTHLVGSFDPNGNVEVFVNGVSAATASWGGASPRSANSDAVWFGRFNGGSFPDYFDGRMDDVRVYNRPLSAKEARGLYDLSRSGYGGLLNRRKPSPEYYGHAPVTSIPVLTHNYRRRRVG